MQKPGIPHDALVLVGDGARAIFFRNKGTVQRPELVTERILEQENPPTHEQGTDRPGRRAGADVETLRGAFEPTDWHQLAEDRFASDIANALYQQAHANRFQRLIIVAPPKVLGTLRKSLHKEVTERIEAEVPMELASYDVTRLQRELAQWG
ncbi:MAG TPA: host attachment family protein [Steroidobacteraceae bacterium]|jgi:protein required for attachment to host cells|nr:host attachment family protein [Steroidobacteraceae bacterium]